MAVVDQQWNRYSRLSPLKHAHTVAKKNAAPFSLSLTTFAISGLCSALSSSVSVLTTIQPASGLVSTITVLVWSQVDDPCDSHWLKAALRCRLRITADRDSVLSLTRMLCQCGLS